MVEIKIAEFIINELELTSSSLRFNYSIAANTYEITIPISNSRFLLLTDSPDSSGLICPIQILNTNYTLFISSSVLNNRLYQHAIKNKKNFKSFERGWYIETVKKFLNFKIYFLRSFDNHFYSSIVSRSNEKMLEKGLSRGFYHSDPTKLNEFKKFILLNFPHGNSQLVQIENYTVSFRNFDYNFQVLIGKFNYSYIEGYAYILHLNDIIKIQAKDGFRDLLLFPFEDYLLPIPNFPQVSSTKQVFDPYSNFTELLPKSILGLYSSFISRSQILSVFISSINTISNINNYKNPESLDQNEFIGLCELAFEYRDFDPIYYNNEQAMPYNYIIFPYQGNNSDYGFFAEVSDYDDYKNELAEKRSINFDYDSFLTVDEERENQIWGDLDTDEKWAMDPDRAESELEDACLNDWKETLSVTDAGTQIFYRSEDEVLQEDINKIFCRYVGNNYVEFEIVRGVYYEKVVAPIELNGFIKGVKAYTGVMKYEGVGDIQFSILERCSDAILKKFLSDVLCYDKYRVLISIDYFICFNIKCNNEFILFRDIF